MTLAALHPVQLRALQIAVLNGVMENIQSSQILPCQHGVGCTTGSLDVELLGNDVPINTKKNCSSSTHEFTSYDLTIALLGAAAGNCLEWFNFSLFGLMADIFGMHSRQWLIWCLTG